VDDHVLEYKLELVRAMLCGRPVAGAKGLPKTEYLSRHTKPTENEARRALLSVLFRIGQQLSDERFRGVLSVLALAFLDDPLCGEPMRPLKVVLKRRSKGHSDRNRDYAIAMLVQNLRDDGAPYDEAAARVGKFFDLDERHIKRIYARHKDHPAMSSDGQSDDMASDR
jgi:hypothetical protein